MWQFIDTVSGDDKLKATALQAAIQGSLGSDDPRLRQLCALQQESSYSLGLKLSHFLHLPDPNQRITRFLGSS
jgi:hypothetical protein